MNPARRQTLTHLKQLFESKGYGPRKHLGQNFLIDLNIVEFIVEQAQLEPDDVVLEVGAGTGGMTEMLSLEAGSVVSVEVDPRMCEMAADAIAGRDNVTLLNCDALKNKNNFHPQVLETVQAKLDEAPGRTLKLISNLPYVIATPVVSNLVATDLPWSLIVVTIQWELAERIRARPGRADYGALSVWLQSQCRVKVLKKLPPSVFWPRPNVESAIVRLRPDPAARQRIVNREFLHGFIRRLFQHRRKFMRSVLVGMYRKQLSKSETDQILAQFDFRAEARAEELDVDTLVALSGAFFEALKQSNPQEIPATH